jgi:ATP-dependent Clp protease ATP-binding subunit ClpC
MNYYKIEEYIKDVYPAIVLDETIPYKFRQHIKSLLLTLVGLTFITIIIPVDIFTSNIFLCRAIFILFLCGYIIFVLLEAMYRSCYFLENKVDIRILKILNGFNKNEDLTTLFLQHELGKHVLYRLGYTQEEIDGFLKTKTDRVTRDEFEIIEVDKKQISFAEFGFSLVHFDSDLSQFFRKKGITVADFKQTLEWVARMDQVVKESQRWWTRESLQRIPSMGKGLAFGQIHDLERFGHNIVRDTAYVQLGEKWRTYSTSVRKIEAVLSKQVGGNILLTAHEAYLTLDAIASLGKEIQQGTVLPALENKRIYVLDVNMLISSYGEKSEFEKMFELVLNQSAAAGNVILVIPNFADFVQNTHSLGADVKDIIREALQSSRLQVIATSSGRGFHEVLETDLDLMTHFEKLHLDEFDAYQAISILQQEVLYAESKEHVFFTYQAVKRIVESADRYFSETSLLDKSIDILYEVIPVVKQQGLHTITQEYVDALVTSKTGISLGKISKDESQKLAHIQEEMRKRVIGQNRAIEAVCDAMLRARTGLANPKRPLASFLFVGPTGVGKTETAKALAALFFNDEENMLRSDMSEYSDADALARMIGDAGHVGIFASKVREKGHGVLLLDEFEKASREVHDLFLQIIDEGFFTDGRGERIMMRNFIIIATSNAGSDLFAKNPNMVVERQQVVDFIVANHVLRTELLNRFDDVIVFDPLPPEVLTNIAHIALSRLTQRLDLRGIVLKETPELIEYLVKVGTNPIFGARQINRVITKELESKIAQALVLGDLFEGDTIAFTVVDNEIEIQKYTS